MRYRVFGIYLLFFLCLLCILPAEALAEKSFQTFLRPYRVSTITSVQRDRLVQLHVSEGDKVTQGQLLAEIDHSVLQARLMMAEQAAVSRGQMDSARSLVALRKSKLLTLEKLEKRGNAKPQELAAARTSLEMAKAQLTSAIEEQMLKKAELKVIQAQIEEKKLYSPLDGTVIEVHKHEGDLVGGSSSEPMITLVQLDPLLADFHLPPDDTAHIESGMIMKIASGGRDVEGKVTFISPTINAQSNTIMIRITLPNPEGLLVGGSRAILTIPDGVEISQ